jgi:uncharacterized phage-associated protein
MKPYKSTILAKYIAAYLNDRGADVNMTKIQKLTYIVYGTYLAITGEVPVDEHPKAWPFGPVFPITRKKLSRTDLNSISFSDSDLSEIKSDALIAHVMDAVFKAFGRLSANVLSEWSHREGSPWERTRSSEGFRWNDTIEDEYIRSYFKKILKLNE